MHFKILLRTLLIILLLAFRKEVKAQYKLGLNSYGMILNNDTSALSGVIASGFAIDSNIIVSCYHIFKDFKLARKFYRIPGNQTVPLRLIDSLPEYDIAILKSRFYLTNMPMLLGDFASAKKGDRISYVGYDKKGASIYCVGFITKIDSIKFKGVLLNRITFSAKDLPCHPGSPILNTKGKLIGMVVKASTIKQGKQWTGVVGYSVKQLKYTRYEGF
jgi:Trypsin-like peptidase domain